MAPCKEEKKFLLELIDVYRNLPSLWKIKSKDYGDRNIKDRDYETLLIEYREYYKEGTKEELKKKLNTLRTNFRKELKKISNSQKSGVLMSCSSWLTKRSLSSFFLLVLRLRLRHTIASASAIVIALSIVVHRLNIVQKY